MCDIQKKKKKANIQISEIKRRSLICSYIYSVVQVLISEVLKILRYHETTFIEHGFANMHGYKSHLLVKYFASL